MSEDAILAKIREAKQHVRDDDLSQAKKDYLDAAEIALELTKSGDKEKKDRYKKIAVTMVDLAKQIQEKIKFQDLENDVEQDPPSALESEPEVANKPAVSDLTRFSSISNDKIPVFIDEYNLPERVDIDITMGKRATDGDSEEVIWKPAELMNGIMMITGGSGSGKTEWLRSMATELTRDGFPVLIFDLHGDIDVDIPTISLDYRGHFGINPMELISTDPKSGGPLPQIHRLVRLFEDAAKDSFSSTQSAYLQSLLAISYETKGILQSDPSTWTRQPPTFDDLNNILNQPDKCLKGMNQLSMVQDLLSTTSSTVTAVKNRLLPILQHPAFSSEISIPIDILLDKPLRILLNSLQTVELQFIVTETVLQHLFAKLQNLGHIPHDEDKFRLFVIIDEVKILSGNRRQADDNYHILNRLATEARKYGMGLILASQVIRHFGRDIRSNSASKLVLRPMDNDEARANAKELGIDEELLDDLDFPGKGYYKSTEDDDAILLQLYSYEYRNLERE